MKIGKLVRATLGGSSQKKSTKIEYEEPMQEPTQEQKDQVTERLENIKKQTSEIDDIIFKKIATDEGVVTVIYSNSLVEKMTMQTMVFIPLTNYINQIHQVSDSIEDKDIQGITTRVISGHTVLFFHNTFQLLSIDTYSAPTRSITNTEVESTVIGPQDAFTESLETNISLVKRRIKSPMLKNETFTIGTETDTKISVVYMDGIVNKDNLEVLKDRIDKLDHPAYTDVTILKQLIEDNPLSPFPQYYLTVRPDTVSGYLHDGRIVVFMENSSAVMICPVTFMEMFMSVEDYYNRWTTASLLRMLRFFGFFLTITITPLYVSALTFHPEILPYELLLNLQESRAKVPFPPLFEVLFIELIIEVLREAGSRMPAKVGQTIGIVGGIVIGTAAVEAGLISNILVVLVATSALLSFLPPIFLVSNTSRFVRYIFIISAGLFGLFGQMIAFTWLMVHLLRIDSLGKPYMSPVIPRKATDLLNGIIRFPTKYLTKKSGISKSPKK